MGIIKAVCISEKRGTDKKNIHKCEVIKGFGLKNDAHGGDWHRQVSLISFEKIEEFKKRGGDVVDGSFGENLIVTEIELTTLPIGTKLKINDVVLEVTQIGKECHSHCEIFKKVGDCIMPREGIFARVLVGGFIEEGDAIQVVE
ncbi:MOSC domain-containing protein [uncultured Fusobacterium sp.]|uniref:MOSC domain-containing protein n=1 Tax=uncultured Fusobacterium sp. TaxID=159267 RepID=UPI0015A729FD|nr:MOSC domain-containing protein [uncultured Fusobacterium sp.]